MIQKVMKRFKRKKLLQRVTSLMILDNSTVNHERYINAVLPVALKDGDNWTFQQDGAKPHTHRSS
jgi:hypothetical protein